MLLLLLLVCRPLLSKTETTSTGRRSAPSEWAHRLLAARAFNEITRVRAKPATSPAVFVCPASASASSPSAVCVRIAPMWTESWAVSPLSPAQSARVTNQSCSCLLASYSGPVLTGLPVIRSDAPCISRPRGRASIDTFHPSAQAQTEMSAACTPQLGSMFAPSATYILARAHCKAAACRSMAAIVPMDG